MAYTNEERVEMLRELWAEVNREWCGAMQKGAFKEAHEAIEVLKLISDLLRKIEW